MVVISVVWHSVFTIVFLLCRGRKLVEGFVVWELEHLKEWLPTDQRPNENQQKRVCFHSQYQFGSIQQLPRTQSCVLTCLRTQCDGEKVLSRRETPWIDDWQSPAWLLLGFFAFAVGNFGSQQEFGQSLALCDSLNRLRPFHHARVCGSTGS